MQGRRGGVEGNGVAGPDGGGEVALETADFRACGEPARPEGIDDLSDLLLAD
jgi:hypothetical protein